MHTSINNLNLIKENLKSKVVDYKKIKIIAVSKTFALDKIMPLIEHGHLNFGENQAVQIHHMFDIIQPHLLLAKKMQ